MGLSRIFWPFPTLVVSLLSGCTAINHINNAKAAYQGVQAYSTAKGMMGAQPAFDGASAFTVTTDLMPRDEQTAAEVKRVFKQIAIEQTSRNAEELGLDLVHCETQCPADTVNYVGFALQPVDNHK